MRLRVGREADAVYLTLSEAPVRPVTDGHGCPIQQSGRFARLIA